MRQERMRSVKSVRKQKIDSGYQESFFEGIKFAKAGNHLFDISGAIGRYAEKEVMVL